MVFAEWLSSKVPILVSLSPILISLLGFTVFVKILRGQHGNGPNLTRMGKLFLLVGFVGIIGSIFSIHAEYINSIDEKERIKQLIDQNNKLEGELSSSRSRQEKILSQNIQLIEQYKALQAQNNDLINKNSELSRVTHYLKSKIDDQVSNISSLEDVNSRMNRQIGDLKEKADTSINFAKSQEFYSRKTSQLAEQEAERREKCLNLARHADCDRLRRNNCADFCVPEAKEQKSWNQDFNQSRGPRISIPIGGGLILTP